MKKTAIISDCGLYRYHLTREWNKDLAKVCFVMLNPSTADADDDDATIRRCMSLAKSWGYGGIEVVNMFAYRATEAEELRDVIHPSGPDNLKYVRLAVDRCKLVILAWGDSISKKAKLNLDLDLIDHLPLNKIHHLGLTSHGRPRHPLFINKDVQPIKYIR